MQNEKRNHHRERNGKKNRRSGARTTQEQQNHHGGEEQSDAAFAQNGGNGLLHEERLVENDVSVQLRRNIPQRGDGFLDAVDDHDCVGVATLLEDRRVNRFLAVYAHNVVLQVRTVHGLTHVRKEDRFFAFGLERNQIQRVGVSNLSVGIDVVI